MTTPLLRTVCIVVAILFSHLSISQEFDVDEADSLDFESFHSNKNKAVQIWNDGTKKETRSSYTNHDGQRFEVREYFKLNTSVSDKTSIFNAVNSLQRQMAQLCPNGWNKLREWTTPADKDYYLYYELQCR